MNLLMTDSVDTIRAVVAERFNLAPEGRSFDCKYIEPGIVSYTDVEGGGIELLRKETIDRAIATAVGNAVTVGHVMVTPENRADVEHGIVQDWYFDAADGWFHVRGVAETDRAKTLMKTQRPSCGYRVLAFGPGGKYHGIRYDKEITELVFNHLAIVSKPRYEDATFRLNNIVSNPENMNLNLFKLIRKIVTRENGTDGKAVESVKEESTQIAGTTEVEIAPGQNVPMNKLTEAWERQNAAAEGARVSGDDEVEVAGKPVKMSVLIENYRKNGERLNAAAPVKAEEPAAAVKTEAKADDDAAGKQAFYTLGAARENAAAPVQTSQDSGSLRDRVARGSKRY